MKIKKLFVLFCVALLLADALAKKDDDYTEEDDDYGQDDEDAHTAKKKGRSDKDGSGKGKKTSDSNKKKKHHKHQDDYTEEDNDDYDDEIVEIDCHEKTCDCSKAEKPSITCDKTLLGEDDRPLTSTHIHFKNLDEDTTYQIVRLRHNGIKEIKKGELFTNEELINSVIDLDLSHNHIKTIESKAFDDLSKLTSLKLGHNKLRLKSLQNVFTSKLEKLTLLELDNQGGMLKGISDGFFDKLKNLKELVLDGNALKGLSGKTFNLENLEKLSLDNCGLDGLPDDFFDKLPKLTELSLRGNPMKMVPKAINKIPHLENLDMSNTEISEIIDDTFKDDTLIKMIRMDNCSFFYQIDNCAFCGLQKLEKVFFNNCTQLKSINPNAFGGKSGDKQIPPNLKEFHCENCSLTTLNEDLVNWDSLTMISLGNNKLKCDCELKWLLDEPYFHTFNGIPPTCHEPKALQNKTLNKVNDLVCPRGINTRIFFFSFLFFVLVIGAIFGFIYYTKKRGGSVTNMFYRPERPQMTYSNLRTNPMSDIPVDNGYTYDLNQGREDENI